RKRDLLSESRVREIRKPGSMSGERKRSVAAWPKLPRLFSTLPDSDQTITEDAGARSSALKISPTESSGKYAIEDAVGDEIAGCVFRWAPVTAD
ncbi:MAG: hypothetical protein WBX25_10460, partial [Rhodomicrobium sp.]